jgi:hypothetical protein
VSEGGGCQEISHGARNDFKKKFSITMKIAKSARIAKDIAKLAISGET